MIETTSDTPLEAARRAIVEAIVALNFNEADKALDILLVALSESNFDLERNLYGNRLAA